MNLQPNFCELSIKSRLTRPFSQLRSGSKSIFLFGASFLFRLPTFSVVSLNLVLRTDKSIKSLLFLFRSLGQPSWFPLKGSVKSTKRLCGFVDSYVWVVSIGLVNCWDCRSDVLSRCCFVLVSMSYP